MELRLEYFRHDRDAKERHEAIAIKAFDEKYPGLSTTDMLHNIHEHKMYALSEDIIALDRYQNVPRHNQ